MKPKKKIVREADLYPPVADFLAARGYSVRAEVKGWDVTAVKGDELIAVELKRAVNLALLEQAAQRQRAADGVYIAVPRPPSKVYPRSRSWRRRSHLLKRLELGLILVDLEAAAGAAKPFGRPAVEVAFHPLPFERKASGRARRAVIREIDGRSADYNVGGTRRRRIVTAYRENALYIACCLERGGTLSPKELRRLGAGPKTQSILYENHYGWFERVGRGLYAVKPGALKAMETYPKLLETCRRRAREEYRRVCGELT